MDDFLFVSHYNWDAGRPEYVSNSRSWFDYLFVQHFRLYSKCTVLCYERIRSLLITLNASHTIIGAPDDRGRTLTRGRICPPYGYHLKIHPKYTVVYYELIRSLLATSYASLTIIGAPDDRSGYLGQYPRPCLAHRPDCSSVST